MKKAVLAMICSGMMVLSPAVMTAFASETAAQEEGQNPIMNFVGTYGNGRGTMLVEADGNEGAKVSVRWASSAFEHSEWTMTGSFDVETLTISYNDCVKKTFTFADESDPGTEEVDYENGTGTITFHDGENLTLTWQDDQDHVADDSEFVFAAVSIEDMSEMPEAAQEASADGAVGGVDSITSLDDGVLTISLKRIGSDKDGFTWEAWAGDRGDAASYEMLTQTDMEEGFAYVGSFRGIEGVTASDTIRLVHTNGFYVDEYMDYDISMEDGNIVQHTGGSHAFPTTAEDLDPVLGGVWQASEDPNLFMELTPAQDGGFDVVVSDGSGRDGKTSLYTMTMYFDALKGAFVYRNGEELAAAITGEEAEAVTGDTTAEALTESAQDENPDEAEGESGYVSFEPLSENEADLSLVWDKDPAGNAETYHFVRPEA